MIQRNLGNNKDQKPTTTLRRSPRFLLPPTSTLRRSPRFLQPSRADAKCTGNPKTSPRKIRQFDSISTPLGSLITKSQEKCTSISQEGERRSTRLKTSGESSGGTRRSVRLDGGGADASKPAKSRDSQKDYVVEKRVTRSKYEINQPRECVSDEDFGERVSILSKQGTVKDGVNLHKQCAGNIEKRLTRSASRTKIIQNVEKASDAPTKTRDTIVLSDVGGKPKSVGELCKLYASGRDESKCSIKKGIGGKICERKMQIGEKRERDQVEEECGIVQGWTKEEELALHRAYFTAKPTPHFWKKVARMVPGKSAEECFDRIHSDHLTPPQPRTRLAANRNKTSSLSFSASKLLSSAETKTKRLRPSKRKNLVAQKMVRQILQKQHNEDQNYEADLFAILEPTLDTSSLNFQDSSPFSSPAPNQGAGTLTRCWETSSSSHIKNFSRLNSSCKAAFVSPPVLKRIKNKALHERYIDQLHCRDAKRKTKSLRNVETIHSKNDKSTSCLNVTSVKTAKDSLVFDAQDAIKQFRSLHLSIQNNDIDDNSSQSDEGEGEDEL